MEASGATSQNLSVCANFYMPRPGLEDRWLMESGMVGQDFVASAHDRRPGGLLHYTDVGSPHSDEAVDSDTPYHQTHDYGIWDKLTNSDLFGLTGPVEDISLSFCLRVDARLSVRVVANLYIAEEGVLPLEYGIYAAQDCLGSKPFGEAVVQTYGLICREVAPSSSPRNRLQCVSSASVQQVDLYRHDIVS